MYSLFAAAVCKPTCAATVSLSDLRERPTVLIGAFNNEWTLSLQGDLRFYFENDSHHHSQVIRDRFHRI